MDPADLGRTGCFADVRRLLERSGYNEEFIRLRYHLNRAEDFELDSRQRDRLPNPEFAADILTALFLAGCSIPNSEASRLVGQEGMEILNGMGLVVRDPVGFHCHATVALYPVENLYIASDRWNNPDDSPFTAAEDLVYPAFVPNTRLFLRHLPESPRGRFLDLCAGTGVGALLAARRGAAEVWSTDITERSTRFAEFNERLNGVENFHALTSDLYSNLPGGRFDMIVAHPPYVPAIRPKWIFYSGGQDGEAITRRMIAELPEHLNPGGVFMALTMAGDRRDEPLERRIRGWLSAYQGDFDVALIVRQEMDPQEFAVRANRDTVRTPEEAAAWQKLFASLRTTALVYGFIVIQRRFGQGQPFTVRRQAPCGAIRSPWEWLVTWESMASSEALAQVILDSPLYAGKDTQFQVRHRLEQCAWSPVSYQLWTDYPYRVECDAQPWMAHLLASCGNGMTGRDALAALKEHEIIPSTTAEGEFARATASLVAGGFLEVEGFRPPRAKE